MGLFRLLLWTALIVGIAAASVMMYNSTMQTMLAKPNAAAATASAASAATRETFEEPPPPAPPAEAPSSNGEAAYAMRHTTLKLFDAIMHKKPTIEEIKKYGSLKCESDVLKAIVRDYKLMDASCAAPAAAAAAAAAPVPVVAAAATAEEPTSAQKVKSTIESLFIGDDASDDDDDAKICFKKSKLMDLIQEAMAAAPARA